MPISAELLRARIGSYRTRLYGRLLEMVDAFDLEDLSLFTSEQQEAIRRARVLIDQINKPSSP